MVLTAEAVAQMCFVSKVVLQISGNLHFDFESNELNINVDPGLSPHWLSCS